ncbi:MAG: hypothetical protein WBA28_04925 [Microbacteriaceae bacterium]
MRIIGTIRPTETKEIEVEAETYTEAYELLKAQIPEGYQLLSTRQVQ